MESSNVVIDGYMLKTIDHDEEVDVVVYSPLEKVGETSSDVKSNHDEEDIQPFNKVPSLDFKEPVPWNTNVIGTKWVYRNKSDKDENIVRNKARLVAQWYYQIEGINFKETFAPVARLMSIRLLLSIYDVHKFILHKMDVKSAFFNGFLQEEVFVEQLKGSVDPYHPNHIYRLKKALYVLKKASRAWYEHLTPIPC
ncbi:hypothetical protein LWI28_022699 [Acer negundo]|uniref:Reverse transcriptase Ty1/copia-type domain-containing protein n=1 Tax=Acer negundo TaxID=4023 RepID=A0AAD5IX60_ACENE|nr:hypothetical protein LWI28_022699 [Acer negundo]